jgi:RNA polymerase sigma-70 factor, ECF subfamily
MTAHDLLERAVLGDTGAIERLAAEYHPLVRRTALGVLGDPDAADDIAQDAMVRLQSSLPGFRGDADLGTWLHRITLNLSYDHLRRLRRRSVEVPMVEARGTTDPHGTDPHRAVDSERARLALRAAIDRLPEEQREVLILRFLSGLSYAEIARVTGARDGTVASRIYRALDRLGSDLEPKHLEIVQ